MFGEKLNISHVDSSSYIYGPGKRYVVWLQGCTLACPGCWNVDMWPHKAKQLILRATLLSDILSTPGLEGVTFLGGEPIEQIDNVQWILEELQPSNLGVMLYTGHELLEVQSNKEMSGILDYLDIIISGRYLQGLRDTNLLWRGSSNQEIVLLSDRYIDYDFEERNQVEIEIDEQGQQTILGFPDKNLLASISNE